MPGFAVQLRRSVSCVQPILEATELIAAHADS